MTAIKNMPPVLVIKLTLIVLLLSSRVEAQFLRSIQCLLRFRALKFDIASFDKYTTYFRNDSEARLAETGVFKGADAIEEYNRFVVSKYFVNTVAHKTKNQFLRYNEQSSLCEFRSLVELYLDMSDTFTKYNTKLATPSLFKLYFNPKERYITILNIFFYPGLLNYIFDDALSGPKTLNYICNVSAVECASKIIQHPTDCLSILSTLPSSEGPIKYIDGNSTGCRALHATFAETNPDHHCPHIAIEPTPDINGAIKCQTSKFKNVSDYFTSQDLSSLDTFATNLGCDPKVGYKFRP